MSMASYFLRQNKITSFLRAVNQTNISLTLNRSIMTSRMKLEKVMENLEKNPYFEKYAQKISQLQKTSPEEFLQRIEEKERKVKEEKERRAKEKRSFEASKAAKPDLEPGRQTKEVQLDSIMKLDLIQDKSKEEITEIWHQYHKQKDCISGVLTKEQFEKMFERGKKYSTFILPLPRENGYEFIMIQFQGTEVHMTPLLWYQTHKENAPECLTITHYTELLDNKGIVLMRGEFDTKSINVTEAQCLANELQMYYQSDHPQRLKLLQTFTEKPDEFKHMDLIAHLETISFDAGASVFSNDPKQMQKSPWSWSIMSQLWKSNIIQKRNSVRAYSQIAAEKKYITTPIFYVNAAPHIGHLYTAVLADSIARFNLMQGHETLLNTGTDEHGKKVEKAAESLKIPTDIYCQKISQEFKKMCDTFNINYTNFIRTTNPTHHKTVQYFWRLLERKNFIYKGKYSGWYCTSDEAFVSNIDLTEIKTPGGEIIKVSAESGNTVEWIEEDNYKFRLSTFQDDLKHWLKNDKVVQPSVFHKILSQWIEDESIMQDLSVSRPINRVSWGIPTPNDPNQIIYVWLDALVNYLSSLEYPKDTFETFWPPTVQVIGKDILKFHGIYWPAFLIAAGLEPPKTLLCHSHWTVNGEKMSKSKGNVVSPFDAAEQFTTEGLRYFLLRDSVPYNDANYSSKRVQEILNSELANTLGNIVRRCTSRAINPRNEIPSARMYAKALQSEAAETLRKNMETLGDTAKKHYESFNVHHAVDAVVTTLKSANVMIDHHKPWVLKNQDHDEMAMVELKSVITLALEASRISALVLYPVIPTISSNLLDVLNVPMTERHWKDTEPKYFDEQASRESDYIINNNTMIFARLKA